MELIVHREMEFLIIPLPIINFTKDLESAAILSSLINYNSDKHIKRNFDNEYHEWLKISYKEWKGLTGLSEHHVKKACKKLKSLGVLKTKTFKVNNISTLHYQVINQDFDFFT